MAKNQKHIGVRPSTYNDLKKLKYLFSSEEKMYSYNDLLDEAIILLKKELDDKK